ncbi:putative transcriptional regulator, MarR family protein [Actinoplanes sp. NBRC 14428]|uniref:MarR family transcriptional regulator n=1 Tax=Pseudosporangium ferrugineum TaxID=439699 RepID=A0A2T0SHH1_9ACTN|nr:MarR family transcriptional regulator [Pseudosporangium ferrugineum]PRY32856.1 MarR family transcriptional regulator [Pseudosporangium ferrugineum]BCJ49190.1 putative transcriptional regulator, MarR family protein [Actinoplanes sp. NBRC 14428]
MEESTGLEQMICFELYAASRAMTGLYRPALDALGITYPQYAALRVIWHRGRITVRDLGAALRLDSGTLSPLLKRLEHQGLIRRERGTHDERVVWISPTDAGTDLEHRVADLPERLACALDLSAEEFQTLQHLLGRIRGAATRTI